jgi:hypothetical protein
MRSEEEIKKRFAELQRKLFGKKKRIPFGEYAYWSAYRNGIEWCLFTDAELLGTLR